MDASTFNLLSIIFSFVAIIVSLIIWMSNVISQTKSDILALEANRVSKDANDIAKRALDIAMFGYEGEIMPDIEGRYAIFNIGVDFMQQINIINLSRGPCKITEVTLMNNTVRIFSELNYPVELRLNNSFGVLIHFDSYGPAAQRLDDPGQREEKIRELLKTLLIRVKFENMIGKKYELFLSSEGMGNGYFGKPIEEK